MIFVQLEQMTETPRMIFVQLEQMTETPRMICVQLEQMAKLESLGDERARGIQL
jgi:hypothetical protein